MQRFFLILKQIKILNNYNVSSQFQKLDGYMATQTKCKQNVKVFHMVDVLNMPVNIQYLIQLLTKWIK